MSLEETQHLLQQHGLVPNKLLGQNFMVDPSVYPKLADFANLSMADVVLDAGAGFGFLTGFLSSKCKQVIAVEKDSRIAFILKQRMTSFPNVAVIQGDVLKAELPPFNKAISAPPYYLSSQLVNWLMDRQVDCALLIVQKEFANRLVAKVGSEQYSWLTVSVAQQARTELFDDVPRWMFHPQPEIDSIILRLTPWKQPPFCVKDVGLFRRLAKWLFTQRNKKIGNALEPFIRSELKLDKAHAKALVASLPNRDWRARDLHPQEFGVIADALTQ
jgi:16S rRNA (adenine1518-N6/adenine1519-N6)-dimethyltransferase